MPLKYYTAEDIDHKINRREGELKLGESLLFLEGNPSEALANSEATFVILGVPEDVGPRANHGKAGAESAWEYFLNAFVNLQDNQFLQGSDILLLGEIDFRTHSDYQSKEIQALRKLVELIDDEVSTVIEEIVKVGKIPILIGGGHNNAYGMLKGSSRALQKGLNCLNLDPHADYRALEGRHSGNGFSYAKKEGFLTKYHVCGLHQSYNSRGMMELLDQDEELSYSTFDFKIIHQRRTFKKMLDKALETINGDAYGIELDCDGIQNFPASAETPSGFSPNQSRMYVYHAANHKNAVYFHLTEAAPKLAGEKAPIWGKLLAYLVSDFIKGKSSLILSDK